MRSGEGLFVQTVSTSGMSNGERTERRQLVKMRNDCATNATPWNNLTVNKFEYILETNQLAQQYCMDQQQDFGSKKCIPSCVTAVY